MKENMYQSEGLSKPYSRPRTEAKGTDSIGVEDEVSAVALLLVSQVVLSSSDDTCILNPVDGKLGCDSVEVGVWSEAYLRVQKEESASASFSN
jgi:hypothetical protein